MSHVFRGAELLLFIRQAQVSHFLSGRMADTTRNNKNVLCCRDRKQVNGSEYSVLVLDRERRNRTESRMARGRNGRL